MGKYKGEEARYEIVSTRLNAAESERLSQFVARHQSGIVSEAMREAMMAGIDLLDKAAE